ncbi:MAG TPA: ring-cleaving dioxygenase [Candidatus Limnocylindrales bacterium]|nr:ring-cleaving dioxygenase [Candidatus Limnocylindrales bacterium]
MKSVTGLHHVTAIAGPPQENLDFYAGVLGMTLVKKSVNQDDPGTYHLFYADAEGHPGSDLTFFPWLQSAPAQPGHGLANEVALAIPMGSLDWWGARLERYGAPMGAAETRFDQKALHFVDPHGLDVALVEARASAKRAFTPSESSPIPAEHQIRGLHGARMREHKLAATTAFLTEVMGFRHVGTEEGWHRYAVARGESGAESGAFVDLAEAPDAPRGSWGVGSIHHIAWRVDDEAHQQTVRKRIEAAQRRPTPVIDRFWFKSVYFTEPGGVLFELATDGPGFAVDEDPTHLGESLVLPPWLETQRSKIEAALPPLVPRHPAPAAERR